MKREKRCTISYWSMFVVLLLLALMVPSVAVYAAQEGTLTVKKFRVEDYENLKNSTGQSSDITDVPVGAETIAGVEYKVEKLLVNATDTRVTTSTPVDTSFTPRTQTTDANGEAVFVNLLEGYYLVTETIPSGHTALDNGKFVVRIPNKVTDSDGNETTNYDVAVYPKGQQVTVEKRVSSTKQVVGIGDIISWEVEYPLGPYLKREEIVNGQTITSYGKKFHLTDEMDTRLDYVEGSVSFTYYDRNDVQITGLILQEGVDYHLPYDPVSHVLTISFTDDVGTKKVADAEVATIRMRLDTKVNASALDTVTHLWNNARISFENTSGDPYEHEVFPPGTDPEDSRVPKVYLGQIAVTKVDENTKETLAGATFYLADSRANAELGNFLTRDVDENGTKEEITITTDSTGRASIYAIGAGTYYLVETQAPDGYRKLTEPIEVTVANNGNANVVQVEVSNTKEDPPPGGAGSGGKGFAGGVKTGDVIRMTGIVLLAIASGGIIVGILRKKKEEMKKVHN